MTSSPQPHQGKVDVTWKLALSLSRLLHGTAMVGVKGLVDSGISSVPRQYIRPRGCYEVAEDCQQVPVIDLSQLHQNKEKVLEMVHQACKNWGFFQLLGHGIPIQYMEEMRGLVAKFFDLPADERETYLSDDKMKGFQFSSSFNPHLENTLQWHDSLFQFCCPAAPLEVLPDRSIPSYSEISARYYKAVNELAEKLMAIFDECLGLEAGTLQRTAFDPPRHTMRMNYYPPCPNPELVVGLEAHSDPGGFTILQQDFDVDGLQVLHNGKWVTVKPVRDALIINVADQLQIVSNGEYNSVEHRALPNADRVRISIATFYCPNMNAYIAPLPQLGPPKYKGFRNGERAGCCNYCCRGRLAEVQEAWKGPSRMRLLDNQSNHQSSADFLTYSSFLLHIYVHIPLVRNGTEMAAQVALLLSALLLAACYLFFRRKQHAKFPPSPRGALPVIGHMHLMGKLPHRSMMDLAKQYGGLIHLRLGTTNTLLASSPEAAREILKTNDLFFASRPNISAKKFFGYNGQNLGWASYGEHWRNMKKLITLEILSVRRVEMFKPLRKVEVSVLMKELFEASKNRKELNMTRKVANVIFNIISRIVMNRSYSAATTSEAEREQAMQFQRLFAEAIEMMGSRPYIGDFIPSLSWLDTHVPKAKKLQQKIDQYLQRELEEHKRNWKAGAVPKDFMDVMLSNGTDDTCVKGLSMDLVGAGTDTSSTTIEWGMAELIKHPHLLKNVQDELDRVIGNQRTMTEDDIPELKYLTAVVKETLRMHPPAPLLLPHESTEACKIGEYEIPAGTRAIVNVYAIGRDPKYWPEPEKFDPERFLGDKAAMDIKGQNFEMLPFGSGRRMCPGNALGYTMVHHILGSLLHAFEWQGYEPETMDMEEAFGLGVPRANPLMLTPRARLSHNAYDTA